MGGIHKETTISGRNLEAAFKKLQEHNIKNDGAKLRVIDVMRLKKISPLKIIKKLQIMQSQKVN